MKLEFSFSRDESGRIKIEWVAFVALLIGLLGAVWQVYDVVRGNKVTLFTPRQILINFETLSNQEQYVRFGAILAYTNTGSPRYSATITREALQYSIGEDRYNQGWQKFVQTDSNGGMLKIVDKGIAAPFILKSGDSESHETYFHPVQRVCNDGDSDCTFRDYVTQDRFMMLISGEVDLSIHFVFSAMVFRSDPRVVTCEVTVNNNLRTMLTHYGWAAPPCREIDISVRSAALKEALRSVDRRASCDESVVNNMNSVTRRRCLRAYAHELG